MREAVELIVRALVDEQDSVEVREVERGGATRLEVRVAAGDMGKLIGRQGRTVKALRSVLHAAGSKTGRRYQLDIIE